MEKLPINCDQTNDQLTDWLSNQLTDAERISLETHLAQCPACQAEADSVRQLWQLMGKLPAPDPGPLARVRFQTMLDTYKDTVATKPERVVEQLLAKLRQAWVPQSAFRLAYSLVLLSVGLAAGYWFNRSGTPATAYQQQIDTLRGRIVELEEQAKSMDALQDKITQSERCLDELRVEKAALEGELAGARRALSDIRAELEETSASARRLQAEQQTLIAGHRREVESRSAAQKAHMA